MVFIAYTFIIQGRIETDLYVLFMSIKHPQIQKGKIHDILDLPKGNF